MKTVEKKFVDWLKSNVRLFKVGNHITVTPGKGTIYHFGDVYYSEEEFKKIENRRLEAYNFYIERTAEERTRAIKHEINNSPYPEKLLKAKTEKLIEKIKPFEESIYSGYKNPEYITGHTSTLILESDWFYYIDDYFEDGSAWPIIEESLKDDKLIQAWADFLLKENLMILLDKPVTDNPKTEEPKKLPRTAEERINRVIEIYNADSMRKYREALDIFHREMGNVVYKDETSFHNAHRNLRKRKGK